MTNAFPPPNYGETNDQMWSGPTHPALAPRKVKFGEAISLAYKNYANFNGRASRSEYWWFYLYNAVVAFVFYFLCLVPLALANFSSGSSYEADNSNQSKLVMAGIFGVIWLL